VAALWVLLAVGINWLGMSEAIVAPVLGDTSAVLNGQVWRLFTAPFFHLWSSPGHLITTLLGLYFLGAPLEQRLTPREMLAFLIGSGAFAYALQVVVGSLVPPLGTPIWFGGLGMVEAVAVAWALSFRGQTVRLFFVLPVSSTMLLGFIFLMSVLNVLAARGTIEGLVTPFGGMLAGWLFGSQRSPLRRVWLRWKLRRYGAQVSDARAAAARGAKARGGPALRVIRGGGDDPPKDKRWLN
jgi:membrane associated rhomboid family serine protease